MIKFQQNLRCGRIKEILDLEFDVKCNFTIYIFKMVNTPVINLLMKNIRSNFKPHLSIVGAIFQGSKNNHCVLKSIIKK